MLPAFQIYAINQCEYSLLTVVYTVYENLGLVFTAKALLETYKRKCKNNGRLFQQDFEVCKQIAWAINVYNAMYIIQCMNVVDCYRSLFEIMLIILSHWNVCAFGNDHKKHFSWKAKLTRSLKLFLKNIGKYAANKPNSHQEASNPKNAQRNRYKNIYPCKYICPCKKILKKNLVQIMCLWYWIVGNSLFVRCLVWFTDVSP